MAAAAASPVTEASVAVANHLGGGHARAAGWPMVGALAITQTVGYGVLYYAPLVLAAIAAACLVAATGMTMRALTPSPLSPTASPRP
jgi:hypothetical protein